MNQFAQETDSELRNHILPFWMQLIDYQLGGFYGKVDHNLKIVENSSKGSIINSRILWAFSASFNRYKEKNYLVYANHAYEFLKNHLIDKDSGGLFLTVDNKGFSLDTRKHINSISYAIYALAEYFIASKQNEAKVLAISLFNLIESKKNINGDYQEEFDQNWNKIPNEFLDRFGLHAEFTFNNQLHILEAYTNLYRIWPEQSLLLLLEKLLKNFETKLYSAKSGFFNEFFDFNWKSIANITNFGHNIEAVWLLSRTLEETGIKSPVILNIIEKISSKVRNEAFRENSIILERVEDTYTEKYMWWVQTEGVISFINTYQLFGNEIFLKDAAKIWTFIKKRIIDQRPNSEWFADVPRKTNILSTNDIVDHWKGPYHNTRMCLEVVQRFENL